MRNVFILPALLVLAASPVLADTDADSSRPGRGWLGVVSENTSPAVRAALGVEHGVVVSSVVDSGPAAQAGLQVGDVITELDGERIEDAGDLRHVVRSLPERSVQVQVLRRGRRVRLTARLGSRQDRAFRVFGAEQFELDDLEPLHDVLRQIRPEVLLSRGDLDSEMDSLRAQLQALREELQELRQQLQSQGRGN